MCLTYSQDMLKAPVLVRSSKLSRDKSFQYLNKQETVDTESNLRHVYQTKQSLVNNNQRPISQNKNKIVF